METLQSQRFTPQEAEVTTSSGRVFKFRELNALEQIQADNCSESIERAMYYRMARSLISLNGVKFFSGYKKIEMDARLQLLRGSEADELVVAYVKEFSSATGEEVKNEQTPPHEE